MVVIVDYGVGNLFSLISSFKAIGVDAVATGDKAIIENADKIILPGVGAFEDASKKLFESGLAQVVIDQAKKGKPILGICLGMQLLFDCSYEYGVHKGLGLIKGQVKPIEGVIPKGEYGGGTVMLFDEGYYKPINNFKTGLKEGNLKFELFGKRLKGLWTLVNFKKENWLLIKGVFQIILMKIVTIRRLFFQYISFPMIKLIQKDKMLSLA